MPTNGIVYVGLRDLRAFLDRKRVSVNLQEITF